MRWSKRGADWRNTPFVSDCWDKWKHPGFSLLNAIVEIYTARFDPKPGWFLRISIEALKREARFYRVGDMLKILQWAAGWPYPPAEDGGEDGGGFHAEMGAGFMQRSSRDQAEIRQNFASSLHHLCTKSHSSLHENDLIYYKWLVDVGRQHVSIYIVNFSDSLDNYTKKIRARQPQPPAPTTYNVSKESSDLNRIEDSRTRDGPPETEKLLEACRQLAVLNAANGKSFNASMFIGKAVKEGRHPAAILEALQIMVRNWESIKTTRAYWFSTLADKTKAHGYFDWATQPEAWAVWSSIASAVKEGGENG